MSTITPPSTSDAHTPASAAAFLGVAAKTLSNWRAQGKGPAYVRYGSGRVAYLRSDLEAYRSAHRVETAGDAR